MTETRIDSEEVKQLLNDLPEHWFKEAKKAIGDTTLKVHKDIRAFKGGLKSRSGFLKRSIRISRTGRTLDTLSGKVFTDSKYAVTHEKGKTITAKRAYMRVPGGPYLNIPLPANKTSAGVLRKGARSVFQGGGFIIKNKKGNYLVMSGQGIPMFLLRKEVEIPKRLGMIKTAEDNIPTLLSSLDKSIIRGF